MYSTSLEWLQPQEDGLRVAIKFAGTDDGFTDPELLPTRRRLRGKQAQQPVVEQGQESDDDLFGGVRVAPPEENEEQDEKERWKSRSREGGGGRPGRGGVEEQGEEE